MSDRDSKPETSEAIWILAKGGRQRLTGDNASRAWLTPGVKGIGGASLLADIGHEIPTALSDEPARRSHLAFGLLAATQSFGNLAASLVAGFLGNVISPSWAFTYLAIAMSVAVVILLISSRRRAEV